VCEEGRDETACPPACTCEAVNSGTSNGISVDCSRRGLRQIPGNLPGDTVTLLLDGNIISAVGSQDLHGCATLVKLDLSNNVLDRLHPGCFDGSVNLRQLLLNGNKLRYNIISSELFDKLKSLDILHIHDNNWQQSVSYNDQLFISLASLTKLSLDGIPNKAYGHGFCHLSRLTDLTIYGGQYTVAYNTFSAFSEILWRR